MTDRYVNNLDAVRAVSVILVMAFHARFLAFGWIGVWVFFALSGFLITRSLIHLHDKGFATGLGIFYARRSLRIFPVYFLYITVFVLAFAVFGQPLEASTVGFLYSYTTNLAPLLGDEVSGRAFAHLWSLGVEEQYYLLVAPVMLLLAPRATIALFATMVLAAPLLRWWAFGEFSESAGALHAATIVKALTPLQMDSFMLGGLLAFGESRIRTMRGQSLVAVAALVLVASGVALVVNYQGLSEQGLLTVSSGSLAFSSIAEWRLSPTSLGIGIEPRENFAYVWLYSLLAANSALLIAAVIRFGQGIRLGIANRIGRVSYGMYVYHSVLVAGFDAMLRASGVDKYGLLGVSGFIALILLTWLIAEASFAIVERPFLRLKERVGGEGRAHAQPSVLRAAE